MVSVVTFTITFTTHHIIFTISIIGIKIIMTTLEMGNDKGAVMSMKNLVSQMVRAPTAKPCREQIAWLKYIIIMMTMIMMMIKMIMMMVMMIMMTIRVKEYLLKPEPVERGGLEAWHCWIHSYTLLVIALMMMILWIKKTYFEVYHMCKGTYLQIC